LVCLFFVVDLLQGFSPCFSFELSHWHIVSLNLFFSMLWLFIFFLPITRVFAWNW
jgi:hypothetical protein